jgi:transcriptional regulator with XRE-family HTH domain
LEDESNLKRALIRARIDAGKTQEDVAKIMHTTKSSISRMEAVGGPSPSFRRVCQYIEAVGGKFIYSVSLKRSRRVK